MDGLKLGVNEWPMPGRIVRRATYVEEYNQLAHDDGIPFISRRVVKDLAFSGAILAAVAVCAFVLGPDGPAAARSLHHPDRPRARLLLSFGSSAILAYLPPALETPTMLVAPILAIAFLVALPFFAGEGEKSWHRRPVAILSISFVAVAWGALTQLGTTTPWSPHMTAWSSDALPVALVRTASPLERQGANVFQDKQCRNCHAIGGVGGQRGPALDDIATRMTPDQLRFKVVTGGGNMPAFGKNLSPAEIEALIAFLDTLHPPDEHPAANPAVESFQRTRASGGTGTGAASGAP